MSDSTLTGRPARLERLATVHLLHIPGREAMKRILLTLPVSALLALPSFSAEEATITVRNQLDASRPGEVVAIPFQDVLTALPNARMNHVVLRNAVTGSEVPAQIVNLEHDHRGAQYDDFVFQYDFGVGEREARFVLATSEAPVPAYESRVFARSVPERFDDMAWENDRIGHRMYGPGLAAESAGRERLRSSGIDVWGKRVPYLVVDRWYEKGHDQFHTDTGEGLDLYSVGPRRGAGGVGVWDGQELHVSSNWVTATVLENGPLRAIFELTYAPWQAGALTVSETKRFTVDAGRNLDAIASTFTIEGGNGEATIAIGIAKPGNGEVRAVERSEADKSLMVWQGYPDTGNLGVGVILAPETALAGFAETDTDFLILTTVKSGQTLNYYAGAGWDRGGYIEDQAAWNAYLSAVAERLRTPVEATVSAP